MVQIIFLEAGTFNNYSTSGRWIVAASPLASHAVVFRGDRVSLLPMGGGVKHDSPSKRLLESLGGYCSLARLTLVLTFAELEIY